MMILPTLRKMIQRLTSGTREFVVFFLGDTELVYVHVSPAEEGLHVLDHGTQEIPDGVLIQGVIMNEHDFQKILERLNERLKVKNVHVLLPDSVAYRFSVYIPISEEMPSRQTIEIELRDHLHRTTGRVYKDLICEYEIVASDQYGLDIDAFVLSAEIVQQVTKVFRLAQMRVLTIETQGKSVAVTGTQNSVQLVIDMDVDTVTVTVAAGTHIVKRHPIQVGYRHLVGAVKGCLGVTDERAQEIFDTFGLYGTHKDPALLSRLEFTLEPLLFMVQKVLADWYGKEYRHATQQSPIERIMLTGRHGNTPGLDHYLVRTVRMPVDHFDLQDYVVGDIPAISESYSHQYAPLILRAKEIAEKGE
ncbi:MAG: Tfp pilus assembly PilM family ATPase [Planctomycetota bacterium]|jgi:Tfp pilus assembly PilM family ATPase